jgi:hypothetical protein
MREADQRAAEAIDRMSLYARESDEREAVLRRLRARHEALQEELRETLSELQVQRSLAEGAVASLREQMW